MNTQKQAICDALRKFVRQRPGFESGNYISSWDDKAGRSALRHDVAKATDAMHHALTLLRQVELSHEITAEMMLAAARYAGRLEIVTRHDDPLQVLVTWTTGQYWCVEFRPGVARYLSALLWGYVRDRCMPQPRIGADGSKEYPAQRRNDGSTPYISCGDWLRAHFRRAYGASIQKRYFD